MVFDKKTRTNLVQWPVEEVESLRYGSTEFDKVKLEPGSLVPLDIGSATQVFLCSLFPVPCSHFQFPLVIYVMIDAGLMITYLGNAVGYSCNI